MVKITAEKCVKKLNLDQTWQATRFTFKYCICMNVVWSFILNRPLLHIFFKKRNYSLGQNILKNMRVWERSLISVPIGVYLDLIRVGTWLGTGNTKDIEDLLEKEWPDAAPDSKVQRPVSSLEVNLLRWSDRTLLFSVRSDGGSASDQAKAIKAVWTRLWLRSVVAPEVLDLSGVDRTLGGSVRSFPPERPVSR